MRRPAVRFRSAPPIPSRLWRLGIGAEHAGRRRVEACEARSEALEHELISAAASQEPAVARAAWPPPSITQLHPPSRFGGRRPRRTELFPRICHPPDHIADIVGN